MKISRPLPALLVAVLAFGLAPALSINAAVSDEDFNRLKDLVNQQGQRLDQLEKAHQKDVQTIEQNELRHQQDTQEIQRLRQQIEQTQKTAADAQQKAQAAAQVQPVHPIPEGPAATHNFTMVGDAEVQFGKTDGSHGAFALADFAPIFLFRARDNVLFEAGFDISLQNNANSTGTHDAGSTTSIGLSFATLDYLFNDYVTFVGGDMLLPLGTYSERAAGWLNKIPDDPLPRDLVPGSGIGVQLRGGVPLGAGHSFTYAVYGANGVGSMDGSAAHDQIDFDGNVGIKNNGTFGNLHASPSAGGRLGWFYALKPHYDLELGISGQSGTWNDANNKLWSAAVVDAALHFGPYAELKGEYLRTWQETSDIGTVHGRGWWVQAGYKLAGLNLDWPYISNLELVGRYDRINDGVSAKTERYTLGYVYYLSNTVLFEGDYEIQHSNDPDSDHNRLVFQVSYGF